MSEWYVKPMLGVLKALGPLGVKYLLYRIVTCEADPVSPLPENIRVSRDHGGERTNIEYWQPGDDRAASFISIWYGDFQKQRSFFKLGEGEAEIAILETRPDRRKLGYGAVVMAAIPMVTHQIGMKRIWGRIWHSNAVSVKTTAKGGWGRPGLRLDLEWRGRKTAITLKRAELGQA